MHAKLVTCWRLFLSAVYIGAFAVGGGYVAVGLMKAHYVRRLKWLSEEELMDIAAIAQVSPGSIAINASILLGQRMAGPVGALVSVVGIILPPFFLLSILSLFYSMFRNDPLVRAFLRGMQVCVGAVIANVAWDLGRPMVAARRVLPTVLMVAAFVLLVGFRLHPAAVLAACGGVGAAALLASQRKGVEK